MVAEQLRKCNADSTAVVASARMTNEELFLTRALVDLLGVTKYDVVPRTGEGDNMLISADRNPNTNGSKMILGRDGSGLADICNGVRNGSIRALVVMNEDITAAGLTAEDLGKLDYLLTISHNEDGTTPHADVVLPGTTFAEKYGTMINVTGRIQRLNKAIEPVGDARDTWEILRYLLERLGCDNEMITACPSAQLLFNLLAEEYEPLHGLTWGAIGNQGRQIMETGVTIPLIERESQEVKTSLSNRLWKQSSIGGTSSWATRFGSTA